jgi:hypothetical protein
MWPDQGPPTAWTRGVTGARLSIIGGSLMVVGSFLPWTSVQAQFLERVPRNGIDNDVIRVIALILGFLAAGVGVARLRIASLRRSLEFVPLVAGLATGALLMYDLFSVLSLYVPVFKDEVFRQARGLSFLSVGLGTYAAGVGALCAIVGGIAVRRA